jgi:hypothetical protein
MWSRPQWFDRPETKPEETVTQKVLLMVLDKAVLAVVATAVILLLKNQAQLAEQRLEKAHKIRDIAVDRPLAIVGQLPAHLDELIIYATQVRAGNTKPLSRDLTILQMHIFADVEGSRAFFANDAALVGLASSIRTTINNVKAQALTTGTLSQQDIVDLEVVRFQCYVFHTRIVDNSIKRVSERIDAAYDRSQPFWVRLLGSSTQSSTGAPH